MDSLPAGLTLGPYRLLNQVGRGGMATVYRAYHSAMDRYVALKLLPRELADNPEFSGRFQQEARTIARLEHAHILPVHDYGQADGYTYLVMRYLEAGTLKDRLDGPTLSFEEVDRILSQLASALQYAHAQGVIHRDLKPSNVLLDASGNLFLTDFGIAKLLQSDSKFTGTGNLIGTPDYMSPEQAQDLPVDQRSDIYSLGIILHEMVTGRVPFEADTPLAVILKHLNEPLPLPSSVKPGLPSSIEKVLLRVLSKNPAERYATAAEFLAAWKIALSQVPGPEAPVVPAAPSIGATRVAPPHAPPTVSTPPATARTGNRWMGWLGLGTALAVLACAALLCGSLWLGQRLVAAMADVSRDFATQNAEAGAPNSPTAEGSVPPVQQPLNEGLPRTVTYAELAYTVNAAVLDNVRPEDGKVVADRLFARLSMAIVNQSDQNPFFNTSLFRLRLAGGEEYSPAEYLSWAPFPGGTERHEVVFEVPAGTQWEGAVLQLAEADREPAELPLTGPVPDPGFPRPVTLPAETADISDGDVVYTLLGAALDLDWDATRAELGQRFLVLDLRLTNAVYPQGMHVGSTHFRLLLDGLSRAPVAATSDVIDYNASIERQVVFAIPAGAGQVTIQLGDVTRPEAQYTTVEADTGTD